MISLDDIHRHWHYYQPSSSHASSTAIPRPILNLARVQGKGRPKGALGGVSRVAESSTQRWPSWWELPSSSAPPALDRPKTPVEQRFIVNSGIKQLSYTALAMARIEGGHIYLYEPGT